jgi:hypothetical protein
MRIDRHSGCYCTLPHVLYAANPNPTLSKSLSNNSWIPEEQLTLTILELVRGTVVRGAAFVQ